MSRSIVSINSTNSTFDMKVLRPELYTVAAQTYAPSDGTTWVALNDIHGSGAASADSYLTAQSSATLHYVKVGKIVYVHGYIVLDRSNTNPIAVTTQELRIQTQAPSATEPGQWGTQLPLPCRASRSATDEGPGASVALLNVDMWNELDARIDGAAFVTNATRSLSTGTGPIRARILADGTLALVELRVSDGGTAGGNELFVAPMVQVALTAARFNTMVTWGAAAGTEARLVVYGQYECV